MVGHSTLNAVIMGPNPCPPARDCIEVTVEPKTAYNGLILSTILKISRNAL
jgi:hypothetical protein